MDKSEIVVNEPEESISHSQEQNHVPSDSLSHRSRHISKSKADADNVSTISQFTVGNNIQESDHLEEKDLMFSQEKDLDFPEGGLKAYLVLFGSFMSLTSTFGLFNSLGAVETHLAENQLRDVKSSTISWIFSIMIFITFLTSVFSGTYFDRSGARLLLIFAGISTVVGLLGAANSTKVWQFILSFSILVGLGGGLSTSPTFGCLAHYFNRRRGLMCAIASTGGSMGGIVFPLMLRKLFDEVGFPWTMRVFALITAVCYGAAILFLKERLPHQTVEGTKWQQVWSYREAVDFTGLKDLNYLFCVIGCALGESAAFIVATYMTGYARARGQSLSTTYLLVSIGQVGAIPGRFFTGYLSDTIGRFNVMTSTLFIAGIIPYITLIPFGQHTGALYAFTLLWGLFTGSVFSLFPVCCGQISKTEEFGRRYGTMYFVVGFATLVAIPIGGAIIGDGNLDGYQNCLVYYGSSLMLASGIFYTLSKYFSVRKVLVRF